VGQNGGKPRLDLNVEAAWAQGYTGRNITTAIMDDGKFFYSSSSRLTG
jgi:proprotein convertase subtilisin/kexin type 2